MSLRNKRVLITAGPTWVPIDAVRVISNIATGETGMLLAAEAISQGAKVTLLLGPVSDCCLDKRIKLIRFEFFKELKDKLTKELRTKKYDILLHSAAVADYQPQAKVKLKISSRLKKINLKLIPASKIIDEVKKINPSIILVGFKFEIEAGRARLIQQARKLMRRSQADLVVANTLHRGRYHAFIVKPRGTKAAVGSKQGLAKLLAQELGGRLCRN